MRLGSWGTGMAAACAMMLMQAGVHAEETAMTGARSAGMAGANAASVRGASAQWHNPAAFGFFGRSEWATNAVDNNNLSGQGFGLELLGAGAGYTLTENLGRYLEILAGIDLSDFGSGNLSGDGSNVRRLLSVAGIISGLNKGDALYADASVGMAVQTGHLGVGLRVFGEGVAYAVPDLDNLSLLSFIDGPDLAGAIADASTTDPDFTSAGYLFTVLTPVQQTDLSSTLGVAETDDSIKYIDYSLQELADAGDLDGSDISAALDTIAQFLPNAGGSISNNQTVVVGRGFAVVEVPVSYGWALNENLAFGATVRAMYGSVLGTAIWIFSEDNDTVLEDLSDNANSSLNIGLDLGVLYRIPNFQFALVGHNLNRPTFEGFTETIPVNGADQTLQIPDVTFEPQITFGAAYMPSQRLTLETNLELLKASSLLESYDIQRFSVGGEVDVWLVALRLGAYRNLAVSWQDWVATAGAGVNLGGVKVDVGGAYSIGNNAEFSGSEIPSEARLYASVGMDF